MCGDRPARDEAVQACRDGAGALLAAGATEDEAKAAHEACVHEAFEARREELCAKAAEKCVQSDAPADLCAEVTMECADTSAPSAGTDPAAS